MCTQTHVCMHVVDHVLNCNWCRIQLSLDLRECNCCTSGAVSVCSDDLQVVGCFICWDLYNDTACMCSCMVRNNRMTSEE